MSKQLTTRAENYIADSAQRLLMAKQSNSWEDLPEVVKSQITLAAKALTDALTTLTK